MIKILLCILVSLTSFQLIAQKFGHFSSEYVVKQMPSYKKAQDEINKLSLKWMDEIKDQYIEIGRMQTQLDAEKVLLTEEMREEREIQIENKLKEAIEYQYKIFGPEGLFFLKKKELVKPELDKIFEAVEIVCKKHKLDYLMDKSSELVLIYTNPVHDYTDYVLEELGLGDPIDTIK